MNEPKTFDSSDNSFRIFELDEIEELKTIEKTTPDLFGYVYFLEYGNFIKIGCTKKPCNRISTLKAQGEKYGDKKIGRVAITPMCTNFAKIEKIIHELFKDKRKDQTELFDMDFYEAVTRTMGSNLDYLDESEAILAHKEAAFSFLKNFILGGN